jgi:hypothetical protein
MHLIAGPTKEVARRLARVIEMFNSSMGPVTVVMAKSGYWHGVGGSKGRGDGPATGFGNNRAVTACRTAWYWSANGFELRLANLNPPPARHL